MAKMVIEILYPEYNNLYGDRGNAEYLNKKLTLAGYDVEIIETSLYNEPAFVNGHVDFLLVSPCQEKHQLVEIFASFSTFYLNGNAFSCSKADVVACFGMECKHKLIFGFSAYIKAEDIS